MKNGGARIGLFGDAARFTLLLSLTLMSGVGCGDKGGAPVSKEVSDNNDAEKAHDVVRAAQSVVLVACGAEEPTSCFRAFAYGRKGDRSFVVVPRRVGRSFRPRGGTKIWILWDGQQVEAKLVAVRESSEFPSTCLLAAPANRLPPPLKLEPNAEVRVGDKVYLVGYHIDHQSQPNKWSRLFESALVEEVTLNGERGFKQLRIRHNLEDTVPDHEDKTSAKPIDLRLRSPGAPSKSAVLRSGMVAVLDQQGHYIGKLMSRHQETYEAAPLGQAYVRPSFGYFEALERPVFRMIGLAALDGDENEVHYQCVIQIMDPFEKVRSPRLRVRRGWSPATDYRSDDEVPAPEPLACDWELELKPGPPDPVVRRQIRAIVQHQPDDLYCIDFTMPNPGIVSKVRVEAQLVYEDENGSTVLHRWNWRVAYEIFNLFRSPPNHDNVRVVPEIPGMIGDHWTGPR